MRDKMNLDQLCAKYGLEISERVSSVIFHLQNEIEEIVRQLEKANIHQKLRNEFNKREISLENARVEKQNAQKWQIKSDDKEFIIEKRNEAVSVYKHKKDITVNDAKKAEVLITKALGVLQEQGLYAFVLFCESRTAAEKSGAEEVRTLSKDLLKELNLINCGDFLDELRKNDGLLARLDDLMLAVQVLEKSLIYARFHIKAMKESQGER